MMNVLRKELQAHLPYSILCTATGLMLTSVLLFVAQGSTGQQRIEELQSLFHTCHPSRC